MEYDDEFERQINARRAQRRRELYRTDPLWRLSKLKANRETRLRVKLSAQSRLGPLYHPCSAEQEERRNPDKAVVVKAKSKQNGHSADDDNRCS